jgi:hypothetical protein
MIERESGNKKTQEQKAILGWQLEQKPSQIA